MIEAAVYRSLLFPMLVAGLPRTFAIAIGTMTMAVAFGLGQIWFIGFSVFLFIFGNILTKKDPYFFDIFLKVIKLPEVAD